MPDGSHGALSSSRLMRQVHLQGCNEMHPAASCSTSFSMTAMRCPWFCVRMLFSSVVLPEPRKPVITWRRRKQARCETQSGRGRGGMGCSVGRGFATTSNSDANARAAVSHRDWHPVIEDIGINIQYFVIGGRGGPAGDAWP